MPEEPEPVKAKLLAGTDVFAVDLYLTGRFEPIDGRYHWGGRMTCPPGVPALLRAGRRDVLLRHGTGEPVPARLLEVDPWGGVRFAGTGMTPV